MEKLDGTGKLLIICYIGTTFFTTWDGKIVFDDICDVLSVISRLRNIYYINNFICVGKIIQNIP